MPHGILLRQQDTVLGDKLFLLMMCFTQSANFNRFFETTQRNPFHTLPLYKHLLGGIYLIWSPPPSGKYSFSLLPETITLPIFPAHYRLQLQETHPEAGEAQHLHAHLLS